MGYAAAWMASLNFGMLLHRDAYNFGNSCLGPVTVPIQPILGLTIINL